MAAAADVEASPLLRDLTFLASWTITAASGLWFSYVTLNERGFFASKTTPTASPPPSTNRSTSLVPVLNAAEFLPFVVESNIQVTHNVKRITFKLPDKQSLELPIGRHLQVAVVQDGKRAMAYYTPVTTNADKGFFQIVAKRYEGGRVSPALHLLQPGDSLLGNHC